MLSSYSSALPQLGCPLDVLARHHRPDDILPDRAPLVHIVALANLYAQALENDSPEGSLLEDKLALLMMARVGLEANMLERMRHRVLAEIDKAHDIVSRDRFAAASQIRHEITHP